MASYAKLLQKAKKKEPKLYGRYDDNGKIMGASWGGSRAARRKRNG